MTLNEYKKICNRFGLYNSDYAYKFGYYNTSDMNLSGWQYITYYNDRSGKVQLRYNAFSIGSVKDRPYIVIDNSFIYVSDPKTFEYFLSKTINILKHLHNELRKRKIAYDFVE